MAFWSAGETPALQELCISFALLELHKSVLFAIIPAQCRKDAVIYHHLRKDSKNGTDFGRSTDG